MLVRLGTRTQLENTVILATDLAHHPYNSESTMVLLSDIAFYERLRNVQLRFHKPVEQLRRTKNKIMYDVIKTFVQVTKARKVIPGCEVIDASVVVVPNALVDVGSDAVVVSAGDVILTTKYHLYSKFGISN